MGSLWWNPLNAGELTAMSIVQRQIKEYFLDPQSFLRYQLQQHVYAFKSTLLI